MDQYEDADEKAPLLREQRSRRKVQRAQQQCTQQYSGPGPGPEPSRASTKPISRCLSWCCTLCSTERPDSPESERVPEPESGPESLPEFGREPSPEPQPASVLLEPEPEPEPGPEPELEPVPAQLEKCPDQCFQVDILDNVISENQECWEVICSKWDNYYDLKRWLWETLEDLDSRELKYFQWFLNTAELSKDGFKPIKKSRLEHADRLDTIDLMVQMYTSKAREVAEKILMKVNSRKGKPLHEPILQDFSASPAALTEKELARILNDFVKKVSRENLTQLMEALMTDSVLNDQDRKSILEENHTRVNKVTCFVDIVTEKGDEACRKMIDHLQTINPTLSSELRLSSGPSAQEDEEPSASSDPSEYAAPPALHDVLQEWQQNFKSELKNKLQHLFEGPAVEGCRPSLSDVYTELHVIEGAAAEVTDKHEFGQIETQSRSPDGSESIIRPGDIFKLPPGRAEPVRLLMTMGVAGIGKSILTQKVTLDWAEGNASQDIQFLFLITFRELNVLKSREFSLVGLIHHFFSETKGICNFEQFQVAFIFDGLDECRLPLDFHNNEILTDATESTSVDVLLTNLIWGNLVPSAHLWITTRPAAAHQIPPECVDVVTEVRGFTDEQMQEYFRKRFRDEEQASRIICQITKSRSLHIMCHIPVFCWITATVLEKVLKTRERRELPKTLTEMYIHFLVVQSKLKKVTDGGTETDPHCSQENMRMIESLGKLAFEQLQKGNLIFYESDLKECGFDVRAASVYSGVFTQIDLHQDKVFCFIHLSVQEFLAAIHVHLTFINSGANLLEDAQQTTSHTSEAVEGESAETYFYRDAVDKALQSPNGHLDLFLRFLLGLSLQTNQILLWVLLKPNRSISRTTKEIVKYIKTKINNNLSADKSISLFHCLNEMKDPSLEKEIQSYISAKSLSTEDLTLSQWLALIFIMFDQKKSSLLSVFRVSDKVLLSDPSERSGEAVSSVLSSLSSTRRRPNLSKEDLLDSGSRLLADEQKSLSCKLDSLRESFSYKQQFTILMHYIVHKKPDLKEKLSVLNFVETLVHQILPDDFVNSSEMRLAISRIITWTTEPKSPDVRKAAHVVLIALFELNSPEFVMLLAVLPQIFQNGARKLLHSHLKAPCPIRVHTRASHRISNSSTPPRQRRSRSLTVPSRCCHDDLHPSMLGYDNDDLQNFRSSSQEDLRRDDEATAAASSVLLFFRSRRKGPSVSGNAVMDPTVDGVTHLREADPAEQLEWVTKLLAEVSSSQSEDKDPEESCRNLLQLRRVVQGGGLVVWDKCCEQVLTLLFETLQNKNHTVREVALQVLLVMVNNHPAYVSNFAELTIVKTLEANKDSHKEVVQVAQNVAFMLAASLPPEQCIKILCPFIQLGEFPAVLTAVKMLKIAIARLNKETLLQLLPDIVPVVLQGYNHDKSSVRKHSVFCLVSIHSMVGEELDPYLTQLSTAKKKLLNLYIRRSAAQASNNSSETQKLSPC